MQILVLGGTSFVGRAIVDDLVAHGHTATLFSRGKTGGELFPNVTRLIGDRESGDLTSLADGRWDAVVDVSGYVPRHVAQAADALGDRIGRYLFISTGSVYDRSQAGDGMSEDSSRLAPYRDSEEITGETYGPLKVACEDDVLALWGDAATIVRPGIVAGPWDPTDRFTWWVRRAARGGRVALPGRPDQPVQVVDSRDLAALVVQLLADDRPGIFNAVGPVESVTLAELVQACATSAGTEVIVIPVDQSLAELPLVLPDATWDVMFRRSATRALEVGLGTTALEQTATDVRVWDTERGLPPLAQELTTERAAELL